LVGVSVPIDPQTIRIQMKGTMSIESLVENVQPLRGPHVIEYPFRRSCGPVLSRFFSGLRDGVLIGIRSATSGVLVPPAEYDPQTAAALDDFVEVGPGGVVTAWAWVSQPRPKQPLQRPFAYALIKLDGADSGFFHAVDVGGDEAKMSAGMRVAPRWSVERKGDIHDIEAFVAESEARPAPPVIATDDKPVRSVLTPIRLEYDFTAGKEQSIFLRGLAQKKILGARRPGDDLVYVPPRGTDPRTAEPTSEIVEVSDRGTVVTYSIVRVPSENIKFELPYVCINVLLDGSDIPFFHVLQKCDLDRVRIGMRVQASWLPDDQLKPSVESIEYFEPIDEPDVPFAKIREYC
jgi:uncharacterized protein